MNLQDLKQHFEPADIEFRAGATTKDDSKALALAYITSRAVMDRLDQVVGPQNWRDEYQPGPNGGVVCTIYIRVGDEWIGKSDGADNTNYEAVKGGLSDAFKRAAVKWGVGRYLYSLPAVWVSATRRGKTVQIDQDEARAKVFGTGGQPRQSGSTPATFRTIAALLGALARDHSVDQATAKAALKTAGYSTFKVSESAAMYQAAADVLKTAVKA